MGRFDVIDPATERKIASVASATVDDAKAALDAAEGAFEGWAGRKPRERCEPGGDAAACRRARRFVFGQEHLQLPGAAADVGAEQAIHEDDYRPDASGGTAGVAFAGLRPGQDRAVRVGRIGGGEDDRLRRIRHLPQRPHQLERRG